MFPFARGSFVGGVCLNSWRVAVVLAPLSLLAAEGPTFDYLQVIESELEPGRVYQFDLPEEVFDGARAFPSVQALAEVIFRHPVATGRQTTVELAW